MAIPYTHSQMQFSIASPNFTRRAKDLTVVQWGYRFVVERVELRPVAK